MKLDRPITGVATFPHGLMVHAAFCANCGIAGACATVRLEYRSRTADFPRVLCPMCLQDVRASAPSADARVAGLTPGGGWLSLDGGRS